MQTTVFDVVHMFSELGISAVPIVDDEGKVLNLYETVDVIVSVGWQRSKLNPDPSSLGSISISRLYHRPGPQATISRLPRRRDVSPKGLAWGHLLVDQDPTRPPLSRRDWCRRSSPRQACGRYQSKRYYAAFDRESHVKHQWLTPSE